MRSGPTRRLDGCRVSLAPQIRRHLGAQGNYCEARFFPYLHNSSPLGTNSAFLVFRVAPLPRAPVSAKIPGRRRHSRILKKCSPRVASVWVQRTNMCTLGHSRSAGSERQPRKQRQPVYLSAHTRQREKTMKVKRLWLWVVAIIGCAFVLPSIARTDDLSSLSQDSNQWVMPSLNYANTRYSKLDQINTTNAKDLRVAWTMSTGALRGHEGQPLVVGDTLYFESAYPNHVFAVDLDDYHTKWQYTPRQDEFAVAVACCDLVNRGVGYANGKIISDALDGTVIALDAATGHVLWKAKNADPKLGQTLTSAPLIVHNKVIVGISGGEFGVRGSLTAYDLSTGKRVWRAYSMGPDSDVLIGPPFQGPHNAGISTWRGDDWKLGGGTTWGWYSYDANLNLLYYGTGNPGTWKD